MNSSPRIHSILAASGLALAAALLFILNVQAAPPAPLEVTLIQPDGTVFTARPWGSAWNHGFETLTGYTILQQPDGWWVYAQSSAGAGLSPALQGNSTLKVAIDEPAGLAAGIRPIPSPEEGSPALHAPFGNISPEPLTGSQKVLVILVEFADHVHQPGNDAPHYANLFFNGTGSLRQYFQETSYNQLTLEPAAEVNSLNNGIANDGIIGWISLGMKHPAADDLFTYFEEKSLARRAIEAVDTSIHFADFDTNHDGALSERELQVVIVVAGHESAYRGVTLDGVWSDHGSVDQVGCPTVDGVVIGCQAFGGGFSMVGELHDEHPGTIGNIAFEIAFGLGANLLFDLDGSSLGVGNWSLMAHGGWNAAPGGYEGSSPAQLDPFTKSYFGWLDPVDVQGTLNDVSIPQVETSPTAYRLRLNPGGLDWVLNRHSGNGEYFLVENRQQTGFDAGLPGCGILVWHIDETTPYNTWANSNEYQPLAKLMQADGLDQLRSRANLGDPGDPFPGSSVNASFNAGTDPNSNLYSGDPGYASLHVDSAACAASMQADLGYTPPAPSAFSKLYPVFVVNTPTRLRLDWEDATNASGYEYCISTNIIDPCSDWQVGSERSEIVLNLLPGTQYQWQVRAVNPGGAIAADAGESVLFTTASQAFSQFTFVPSLTRQVVLPSAVTKSSPASNQSGVTNFPELIWNTIPDASYYLVCYDSTRNGTCDGSWVNAGSSDRLWLKELLLNTYYEWQVKAVNQAGETLADSGSWWQFRTTSSYIPNGDFDLGAVNWVQYSSNGQQLILPYEFAYTPPNIARLGVVDNETSNLWQRVFVPSGTYYYLYFRTMRSSTQPEPTPVDRLTIYINGANAGGMLISGSDGYWVAKSVNLIDFRGNWIQLDLRVTTNSVYPSTLYIDNVTFFNSAAPLSPDALLDPFTDPARWLNSYLP